MNDSSRSSDSPTPPSPPSSGEEPSDKQSKSSAWQSYRRLKSAWKERREQRRQRCSKRGINTDPSEPTPLPTHSHIPLPPLHTRPIKMAAKLTECQNVLKHYFTKLVDTIEISADFL